MDKEHDDNNIEHNDSNTIDDDIPDVGTDQEDYDLNFTRRFGIAEVADQQRGVDPEDPWLVRDTRRPWWHTSEDYQQERWSRRDGYLEEFAIVDKLHYSPPN